MWPIVKAWSKYTGLIVLISKVKISEGVGWEVLLLTVTDTVIGNMLYIFNTKMFDFVYLFKWEDNNAINWQNLKARNNCIGNKKYKHNNPKIWNQINNKQISTHNIESKQRWGMWGEVSC